MLRIQQIKLPIDHSKSDLEKKIIKSLKLKNNEEFEYSIYRRSIDARKKDLIFFVYHIDVHFKNEQKYVNIRLQNVAYLPDETYSLKATGTSKLVHPPVIVGSGPSGLFSALLLARLGYNPIVIERGKPVEERVRDVELFWNTTVLNTESNVQFGEGGAGTFSDGKLNTLVKDKNHRGRKVLMEFIQFGAPEEIAYLNKPHIGTDQLRSVVKNMREEIIGLGGQVRFETKMTGLLKENNKIVGVVVNEGEVIPTNVVLLGIGHSARDTFKALYEQGVNMEQKSFAIGVRIEHPQSLIDKVQYGNFAGNPRLGAADYKLKAQCSDGRGVYSFCMCPGGLVVASASEEKSVVTNGMSYFKRDLQNANSALLVTVNPHDFGSESPLAGVEFQRTWERKAFEIAGSNYKAPAQLVGDFLKDRCSKEGGRVLPTYSSGIQFAPLKECLPSYVINDLKEGIQAFDRKIPGFAMEDSILTGVETRSSSPVRILRDESFQSNIEGLYPMGEGAGYAGGIMSAAMDGIKIAESIASTYCP